VGQGLLVHRNIESNRRDNSVNPLIVPTKRKKKKDSPSKKHQINPPLQKPEAGTPAGSINRHCSIQNSTENYRLFNRKKNKN
jgi:hypothetical protein